MAIEITSDESWFGRIGSSIKGVLFGGLLFLIAFPVLFMNEGRAVRTAKGLAEGAGAVRDIDANQVESQNEGQFVHLTGEATTDEILRDNDFGIELNGIRLNRHVEMYQWNETTSTKKKKKLGGGTKTVTTYDYEKSWKSSLVGSIDFQQPDGHENPSSMPFTGRVSEAKKVNLGAFSLSDSLIGKIRISQPVDCNLEQLPEAIAGNARIVNEGGGKRIYLSANQENSANTSEPREALPRATNTNANTKAEVVVIDFGDVPPGNSNYNMSEFGDTDIKNLVRLSDGASTGISLTVTGATGNNLNGQPGNGGNTTDDTIYGDGLLSMGSGKPNDNIITFTLSGLDDTLTYKLTGGTSRVRTGKLAMFKTNWTISGTELKSNASLTNGYVTFTTLKSSGGVLTVAVADAKNLTAVSQIELASVPKPSTAAPAGLEASDSSGPEPSPTEPIALSASDSPEIGDVRVWFTTTPNSEVSVMSKQAGNGFVPFKTQTGTQLHMLAAGNVSAKAMIEKAEADNAMLTWLLRGVGAAMMCIGIGLFLSPLTVIGDVVPFVGSIVGTGVMLVATLTGLGVAFCTISVAWIFYRPLIGIPLLVLGLGLIFMIACMIMKKRSGKSGDSKMPPVEVVG